MRLGDADFLLALAEQTFAQSCIQQRHFMGVHVVGQVLEPEATVVVLLNREIL